MIPGDRRSDERLGYDEVKILYGDACLGFDCSCGIKDIVLTDEEYRCDCGRIYRLQTRLLVRGPEPESRGNKVVEIEVDQCEFPLIRLDNGAYREIAPDDWFLLFNYKRMSDPETHQIHPFYTKHGIPRPLPGHAVRDMTIPKQMIDADLAQELLRLIDIEARVSQKIQGSRDE